MLTAIFLGFFVLLSFIWYRSRKEKQLVFKNLGISGPEPSALFGNISKLDSKGNLEAFKHWTKKYGKVFGYFEGTSPVLMISDPNIAKDILVKNFHKFHSRKPHILYPAQKTQYVDMSIAQGDKWKQLRTIATLSFTAKRMTEMSPLINQSVDVLMGIFKTHCNLRQDFDIYKDFTRLTLDIIASCAFGIDACCLSDPYSEFLKESKKLFGWLDAPNIKFIQGKILVLFPEVLSFLRKYYSTEFMTLGHDWHLELCKKIIHDRQLEPIDRVDFITLMLEANENARNSNSGDVETEPLTLEEMQSQIASFLLAGYETTSAALGFTCYELALHPTIQEKLQKEIDEHFPEYHFHPDYNSIQNLKYMDMVFDEVLRMYPIAEFAVSRQCFEDHQIGDLKIPKGMGVTINMHALHYNSDLWRKYDPTLFVPERFGDGKKDVQDSCIWLPFGAGPRTCVGMRFAILEYKIVLARLLKNFTIVKESDTKVPCPIKQNGIHGPSEGVTIFLERR